MKTARTVSAVCALGLMIGCGSTADVPETESAGSETITIAFANDITTMDQSMATDSASFDMLSLCMSGLTQYDADGEVAGDLAETWDISEDGLTWTFHLREGIKYSDGTPITADDFVYSWRRLADPETGSEYAYILDSLHIVNADAVYLGEAPVEDLGVEAADEKTFVVHLSLPCAFLGSYVSTAMLAPLNEAFVESKGDNYAMTIDDMLYSGVYKMTGWVTGSEYTFTHNENYWDAENYPQETMVIRILQDEQASSMEYLSGNLDVIPLSGELAETYSSDPGYTVNTTAATWWIMPNMNDPIASNLNLRKAIAYSIDRATICENVLKTGAIEADGVVAAGLANGPDGRDYREAAGDMTSYDPETAAEYYALAVEELGGHPSIELIYDNTDELTRVAENMQAEIQKACEGITITLRPMPKKSRIEFMLGNDFQMCLCRWAPDYADPQSYIDFFTSTSSMNGGRYTNEVYDDLAYKAAKGEDAADDEKRWNDFIEAERILVSEDYGAIPVYQEGTVYLVSPDTEGYLVLTLGTGRLRHMTKAAE
ncbi:MAG: peptide ABC transporter substrate-binding protein [Solobacterium sp.]|nr:peptide ABC transporter substrate-binding protein [Solobacterium sp.]